MLIEEVLYIGVVSYFLFCLFFWLGGFFGGGTSGGGGCLHNIRSFLITTA